MLFVVEKKSIFESWDAADYLNKEETFAKFQSWEQTAMVELELPSFLTLAPFVPFHARYKTRAHWNGEVTRSEKFFENDTLQNSEQRARFFGGGESRFSYKTHVTILTA